jgi:transposase
LLNAEHLHNVPGRKTDVADAIWICELVEHGLVRPSFVSPGDIRQLRDLTRHRRAVIDERGRETQRLHKTLDIAEMLARIDHADATVDRLSARIAQVCAPFARQVELLCTIPGIAGRTAEVILAERSADMSRFATSAHLASWAGMCPGNNASAGKHHSGRTRKGSNWLRRALVEAAHAAARSKGTYLSAHYHRIKGRRGPKKAAVAVGHSILVIAYHLLDRDQPYSDLGADYFIGRQNAEAYKRRLIRPLERMGHTVAIEPTTSA